MDNLIFYAAFGGLMVNGLSLLELGTVPRGQWPDFRSFVYWLPFLAWPAIAAVLASAYIASENHLNPVLAINVGASAPLILKGFITATPFGQGAIDPGPGA